MKLIIELPDYNLNNIQNGSIACSQVLKAVKNGIPYKERPIGRWIDTGVVDELGHVAFECSICHKSDEREETEKNVPFCKYCGASMGWG